MLGEPLLVLSESILHLAGGVVGLSVARVARHGYRETGSPTLLRLSIAFVLLGFGLSLTGVAGLLAASSLQVFALGLSMFLVIATSLETGGYFFLALSQGIKARAEGGGLMAAATLPTTSVLGLLKSLSFVFLLYGMLETLVSYLDIRRRQTLIISSALGLIALGEFTRWFSLFITGVSPLLIASILLKLFGFIMLYTPVIRFSSFKGIPQYANI